MNSRRIRHIARGTAVAAAVVLLGGGAVAVDSPAGNGPSTPSAGAATASPTPAATTTRGGAAHGNPAGDLANLVVNGAGHGHLNATMEHFTFNDDAAIFTVTAVPSSCTPSPTTSSPNRQAAAARALPAASFTKADPQSTVHCPPRSVRTVRRASRHWRASASPVD